VISIALKFPALLGSLSRRSAMLLALLAGALNVLSFAPFHVWPLQILSLALLFLLVLQDENSSLRRSALLGGAYGFGLMFFGSSWLIILMTRYNDLPLWLSLIGMALLAGYLALFGASAMAITWYLRRRWKLTSLVTLLFVLPAIWALTEWLRGWVLTGFPWIVSGYAHTPSPLAGYAAIFGVYGVGWISAIISGALALLILQRQSWKWMSVLITVFLASGMLLKQHAWTQAHGQPISVRLLQGNVDQGLKFDLARVQESLVMYHDMIVEKPADLIATPETALPMLSSNLPVDYLPGLNAFAQSSNSRLIVGVVAHDGDNLYANSVLGFGREYQTQSYRYDKHHLVPFGEFIPFGFRWFINMMKIPFGELSAGVKVPHAMQVKDQFILPNICYETLFGEEIAQQLRNQSNNKNGVATILLNVSNMAWYGDSIAMPQHLQISQMRALETGRPMLQATNTGATAFINAQGQIVAQLKPLTKDTLSATVQGMTGLTPYIMFGNGSAIALALLSLLLAYGMSMRRAIA
jgi:apolipoprotein N-acyltransferase